MQRRLPPRRRGTAQIAGPKNSQATSKNSRVQDATARRLSAPKSAERVKVQEQVSGRSGQPFFNVFAFSRRLFLRRTVFASLPVFLGCDAPRTTGGADSPALGGQRGQERRGDAMGKRRHTSKHQELLPVRSPAINRDGLSPQRARNTVAVILDHLALAPALLTGSLGKLLSFLPSRFCRKLAFGETCW